MIDSSWLKWADHAIVLALLMFAAPVAKAIGETIGESDEAKLSYFENKVRPALTKYCLECHAGNKESNGGLLLDSRPGWEKGGESGRAVVPGLPDESRLIKAIRYDDPMLQMPPEERLPADIVKVFEKWIADGGFDPRVEETNPVRSKIVAADWQHDYWSYRPLQSPHVPLTHANLGDAPIDLFINQRLESVGLDPSPIASRRNQVRRLFFDLTGLPPTCEEVKELEELSDLDFEAAYRNLVEKLLTTTSYGEAFARRWMDVARYAESVTLRGLIFKEAWRYRDYLVKAYSQDRPFDQMICEQIAGDLLKSADLRDTENRDPRDERWMQLVATSFLAMGDTNFEEQDKQQLEMDYVDEQLNVIGQAFLGQTIGCARCHDHKFDPIPTKDYYAIAGILKSAVALRHSNVSNWIDQPLPLPENEKNHFVQLETELEKVTNDIAAKKKLATALSKKLAGAKNTSDGAAEPNGVKEPSDHQGIETESKALAEQLKRLEIEQQQLQKQVDLRPKYLTVVEEAPAQDLAVHVRGDVHNLGAIVPRGFLSLVKVSQTNGIPSGASGRLEFAKWIASSDNPMTGRVYANRVWTWLMGKGLVDSVNNFGTTGTLPSHPELLDWLAAELIRSGWSTKHLVRTIVLSDAYRRRVRDPNEKEMDLDPENRLLWRGNQRRLSAEELRDAMLLASGELDCTQGGTLMKPGTKSDFDYQHDSTRRSIYQPVFRNSLPALFDAFDFAGSSVSTGQRNRSTVATQALALLNDSWIHLRAKAMANKIHSELVEDEPEGWIRSAYERCFQRRPTDQERLICLEFFSEDETSHPEQLERLTHTLLASLDFRYLR